MNSPNNSLARREPSQIEVLKSVVARKADDFKTVLPSHITVDKFQRVIATAALSNPKLFECDRQSLLIAAMRLAMDGLLPDGREAALVPFKTRVKGADGQFYDSWQVQAMPMAYGLRKKVLNSGEVISLQVGVVYKAEVDGGNFLYEIGIEPPIRHRPKLDMTEAEVHDDNIVAAYSIARIKNPGGDPYWSVEIMPRHKINKVRQMSQTGALGQTVKYGKDKGKPIDPKGPWVDWFAEMACKSVLRAHTKVLPMSGDLLDTLERDDAENLRAEGAAKLLETETRDPVRLPASDDLAAKPVANELIATLDVAASLDDLKAAREAWAEASETLEHGDNDDVENAFMRACERLKIDPNTGEVLPTTDPATGMTIVSEEEARALDAAQGGDAGDGECHDAETGEVVPDGAGVDPFRGEVWAERRREILDLFNIAETVTHVRAADELLVRHLQGFPGEIQQELEKAATDARNRIKKQAKA